MEFLIFVISIIIIIMIVNIIRTYNFNKKELKKYKQIFNEMKPEYDLNKKTIKSLDDRVKELTMYIKEKDKLFDASENKDAVEISSMYSDMITLHYHLTAQALKTDGVEVTFPEGKGKKKKFVTTVVYAPKAAERVEMIKEETKIYIQQYKCMQYKYKALLEAFPGIGRYVDGKDSLKELNEFSNLEKEARFYEFKNITEEKINKLKQAEIDIEKIIKDALIGKTKWLSSMIADYYSVADGSLIEKYKLKKYPISIEKSNELYNVINGELRELRVQNKELEYLMNYYQESYPELEQNTPENLLESDIIEDSEVATLSVDKYYKLTKKEYSDLEPAEKNQLILDRYWKKRKSKWVIGRDYERYIGYLFEKNGYKVLYQGALTGKEDRGIDLVAENNEKIILIQCKYWRLGSLIRENAINQLYGTSKKYSIDYDNSKKETKELYLFSNFNNKEVEMQMITSSTLTDVAKDFAKALGVIVKDNVKFESYPIIKCNISANGDKIYHLPFDQQYDTTKIENQDEFYATTILEAENKGFRRAYRWLNNQNNKTSV